ncbi:MAG: cytochrome-c oxidase, cbb3-type subunit II [Burkholderiaceae bacterium]|jgi:cytochrome c oxidase cbb3-type subunit 2|nr:cytochrome-c oxidase, cbb3-type subunit II [Burkholderiaceae bacterium]
MSTHEQTAPGFSHEKIETNNFLMIVLIVLVVAIGGLVEIVPLFFQKSTMQPLPGVQPLTPLQVLGRDVYLREGCYVCHSQMIRPFPSETLRYGHYSEAGESVYDHPFQWGSKRTGPDLARVGGRYTDEWHHIHLNNPRDVVPESVMPAYSWLGKTAINAGLALPHMEALKKLGVPYADKDFQAAQDLVKQQAQAKDGEKITEADALVSYLQSLGHAFK